MGSKHFCQLVGNTDIYIAGEKVPCCDFVKTLGIVLDKELTFTRHISQLCQRAYFSLKQLLPFKYLLDSNVKLLLCESLVLSVFNYADVVYGPCISQTDNQRLQKLQNLCIRFITYIPPYTHITPYIRDMNCLKIQERRFLHYAVFLRRIVNSGCPSYLADKILLRNLAHDLNLRHVGSTLSIPKHSTSGFKCGFSYLATYIYNNFLSEIAPVSIPVVKKLIKNLILSNSLDNVNFHLF